MIRYRFSFASKGFLIGLLLLWSVSQAQERRIQLDGEFDSGNLRSAQRIAPGVFNIELEPFNDAAVWFHFRVVNAKDSTVTFHLLNGKKGEGIWNWLAPAVSPDWQQWEQISEHSYDGEIFSFTYTFPWDTAYVCTHPAFNTAAMVQYLNQIEAHPKVVQREVIARSVQGRPIEMVTLTDPNFLDEAKLGVFFISRQHASELAGWYVLQGLMNWLLSHDPEAEQVMRNMVFNIVPMMNPDGVYLGKYRTTALNIDLNRQWDNASAATEPSVYAVVNRVANWVNSGKDYSLFIDFHATKNGRSCFTYRASRSLVPGFITQQFYNNQEAFINILRSAAPLINTQTGISTGTSTRISRQYMIRQYQSLNPKFLALIYEGINVPVNYGPYAGQPMTIDLEHQTGVGFGKTIYQHYVAPLSSVEEIKDACPAEYDLLEVYPNPAKERINILFGLNKDQRIGLRLYNLSGQVVSDLVSGELRGPGTHTVSLMMENLPAGVYFLVLKTERMVLNRKIVHIH